MQLRKKKVHLARTWDQELTSTQPLVLPNDNIVDAVIWIILGHTLCFFEKLINRHLVIRQVLVGSLEIVRNKECQQFVAPPICSFEKTSLLRALCPQSGVRTH